MKPRHICLNAAQVVLKPKKILLLTTILLVVSKPFCQLPTADPKASLRTRKLLNTLNLLRNQYTILGHQDDLAYGNGWRYQTNNPQHRLSDVQATCGDFPGCYGWDIGQIERKLSNSDVNYVINGVLINDLKKWVTEVD